MKQRGTVKWFNDEKGFGFISEPGKPDLFVHFSAIDMAGYRTLVEGDPVEFEIATGPRGSQAFNVVRLEERSATQARKRGTRPIITPGSSPPHRGAELGEPYPVPDESERVSIENGRRALKVFLCHSNADKPTARLLYRRLRQETFTDPWLDEECLLPGQDWDYEIRRAVRSADVVIVCISNDSISKRGYVQREIAFALDAAQDIPEGEIFIVPLRLEQCSVPERLSGRHWIDYLAERDHDRLLKALQLRWSTLRT